jgi:predicted nucleic acid-binding protein
MLIDSNIIIYGAQPAYGELRRFIAEHSPVVSAISIVEVLGYHKLSPQDRHHFERFFAAAPVLPCSEEVIQQAAKLRQVRKMTLGDALVAGTALLHKHTLVTCNLKDFVGIAGLELLDPVGPR